jgi:PAS domain S-box-containing protein
MRHSQFDRREWEARLRFETLLADLSARFINLPADQVDAAIEDAQRRICECLGLDLSSVWQLSDESNGSLWLTHVHRPHGGAPLPDIPDVMLHWPWTAQKVMKGEMVIIPRVADLPPEAAHDRESCIKYGIRSALVFPLQAGGGEACGALSFNTMCKECEWPQALVQRLHLGAQVFANALARKQAEQLLRKSEARLQLATDFAGVGLWSLDTGSGRIWASDRIREMFHFTADEVLTLGTFLARIHPEDRELVDAAVREALACGTQLNVDYRIELPDGELRWIAARAGVHPAFPSQAQRLLGCSIDITTRKHMESAIRQSLEEVQQLRDRLQIENVHLREQMQRGGEHHAIVGESHPILTMLAKAKQVARTDSAVLITGETGTGKELLAQAIHAMSRRNAKPMVKVNCAALPAPLIEGELFGREKGAYTGAMTRQIGRFEVADGSTIFLDEIGDLSLELQTKLLRVLQDGRFERLGSHRTLKADVRVIAATNHDLIAMVGNSAFREDLFHRLNVFPIEVPPLRSRVADIPLLVWEFVGEFNKKMGMSIDSIPRHAMEQLTQYPWPGNVRELRNVIERALIVSNGHSLKIGLPVGGPVRKPLPVTLEEVERKHILDVLECVHWRISGTQGAAKILGLNPTTLHSRMKKLGISRPKP